MTESASFSLRASAFACVLLLCFSAPLAAQPIPLDEVAVIAAGNGHSCAGFTRGGARCWGRNDLAQLGDGTRSDRILPVTVSGISSNLLALAAGDTHSCAILDDDSVRCWGMNFYGQLGDGTTDLGIEPVATQGLGSGVRQIGGGENHSCALTAGGGMKCWGANYSGQLGDGSDVDRLLPVDVLGLARDVRSIAVGHRHSCAVLEAGTVRCWGFNFAGQLGDGSEVDRTAPVDVVGLRDIVQVAAGERHTCALSAAGAVSCWGANSYLQLGTEADENGQSTPGSVAGLQSGVIAIDLGANHSCALLEGGRVRCWGRNDLGQLGDGSVRRSREPVEVSGMRPGVQVLAIGSDHGCALQGDGGLRCWGQNFNGQLGNGSTTQAFTPTITRSLAAAAQALDVGEEHSCALLENGQVQCWGLNYSGQLGDGSQDQRLLPAAVSGLAGVSALDVGGFHGCALRSGAALCWGRNDFGQLGDDSGVDQALPVPVLGLSSGVQALSAGGVHSCAIRGGGVLCWGHNYAGQLGDGTTERRFSPVEVVGLRSGIVTLATSFAAHSCAISSAGGLKCWGANERGQLGDGSRTDRLTPIDVPGLASGVRAVALGAEHSCAINAGGGVLCWGSNDISQLGTGDQDERLTPTPVPGLGAGAAALALGRTHSCARMVSGAVRCWGRNDFGQLGDGSSLQRAEPVPVSGLGRGVRAIASGAEHSCALLLDGGIKCWGSNYSGQFGDGRLGGVPLPLTVKRDRDARLSAVPDSDAALRAPDSDASGRYLVFESRASGLAGDSGGRNTVYRVDTHSGALQTVSLDNAGQGLSGDAGEASISADGQQVVFVAPDAAVRALLGESAKQQAKRIKGGQHGIFLRNMQTGTTQRVGTGMASGSAPALAAQGGAIAYASTLSDPALGPVGSTQVFVQTLPVETGAPRCVSCKQVQADGNDSTANSDGEASFAVLSADGQWVAWQSSAQNVLAGVAPACPQASNQILLRNLQTGQLHTPSAPAAAACAAATGALKPSIDYSGLNLAFQTDLPLLAEDENGVDDVYVFHADSGELQRASQTVMGTDSNGASFNAAISGDGAHLVFSSEAKNLVDGEADDNEVADILARDLQTGQLSRVSSNALGDQADAPSDLPVMNFAGSQIAFESAASNLLLGTGAGLDNNGLVDLFQTVNPVAAAPLKSATWWKQSEAGWGLFVFDQGNLQAPAWFTYDVDGEPTWFLVGGAFPQDDGSFRGDLFRFTGVPLAQIEGPASDPPSQVGTVDLRYFGEQVLRFDYSVDGIAQSKTLTRFPFGERQLVCRASADTSRRNASNFSDVWWGGEQTAGWGLFLNHVDESLFAIWYTYDSDREALFLVITTTRQPDGRFVGEVYRQANGTPFSMIDEAIPSADAQLIGSAWFEFSDGANGVFSYSLGAVNQSKPITRLQVGSLATACETATPLQ